MLGFKIVFDAVNFSALKREFSSMQRNSRHWGELQRTNYVGSQNGLPELDRSVSINYRSFHGNDLRTTTSFSVHSRYRRLYFCGIKFHLIMKIFVKFLHVWTCLCSIQTIMLCLQISYTKLCIFVYFYKLTCAEVIDETDVCMPRVLWYKTLYNKYA